MTMPIRDQSPDNSAANGEMWLILLLQQRLTIAEHQGVPGNTILVNGIEYLATSPGSVATFYDRILDDAGKLTGIRFWPTADDPSELLHSLPMLPYVRTHPGKAYFDVYFCGYAYEHARGEGEQAFGGRIYRSSSSEMAVAVDFGYLAESSDDILALRSSAVRWLEEC